MINLRQIERLLAREQYPLLIRRIIANGRPSDRLLLSRLKPAEYPLAALGLALQRIDELTPGHCTLGDQIAARIAGLLGPDVSGLASHAARIAHHAIERWQAHTDAIHAAAAHYPVTQAA